MQPTVYQKPEIRDANDNIIQQGAFGKNTALANATNDGWIDYVANDLEFLYDLAKDEVVPVPSLPASGQTNKTYLLTTTGVSYRWSGTEWVAVSSSEAVGRAESAANLAEQWATKTDGTVDGTEYSAKYYAELAQDSADDAQDVADDMADHLVQIDKNTGGVSANSKRISNIEKLLQGNLYDYDTDDDVAYVKDVPSGALPYAGIEQIGGKTLVMNQKANSINATYWQGFGANVSVTYADGVAECTLQNDTASAYMYGLELLNAYAYNIVDGHKYYYSYEVKINITGTRFFNQCVTSSSINDGAIDTANIWIQKNNIVTATAVNPRRCLIYPSTNLTGLVYSVRNAMVIDLTLMYGAGNEPSTVAEFEAMFPADYYPYNAGTLLSAGVTEVVSNSTNIFDYDTYKTLMQSLTYPVTRGTVAFSGNGLTVTATSNDAFTTYGGALRITIKPSVKYTLSVTVDKGGGSFWLFAYNSAGTITTSNHYNFASAGRYSTTITSTSATALLSYRFGVDTSGNSITFSDIQIEESATATEYKPYAFPSLPIPAEVQALTGYGWSTNAVSNYIDYESKKFIKNVASVDLGTLNWTKWTGNQKGFYALVSGSKGTQNGQIETAICQKYVGDMYSSVVNGTHDKIFNISNNTKFIYLYDSAYQEDTATNFKASLSGVTLYYELATPVETDISQYLTDNLIEVGAGGTLTFPNANGDDYHIPVPSTETYMIDLQEAISNG